MSIEKFLRPFGEVRCSISRNLAVCKNILTGTTFIRDSRHQRIIMVTEESAGRVCGWFGVPKRHIVRGLARVTRKYARRKPSSY